MKRKLKRKNQRRNKHKVLMLNIIKKLKRITASVQRRTRELITKVERRDAKQ